MSLNAKRPIALSVAVDELHLGRLPQVIEACRAAGLQIDQVLSEIGVLTGKIDAAALEELRRVAGVASVEIEREVGLPGSDDPPD